MKFTSIFKKLPESASAQHLQGDIAAGFAVQAVRDSACSDGLSEKSIARVWTKIDQEFAAMSVTRQRQQRVSRRFFPSPLVIPLALCCALAFYVFRVQPQSSDYSGVKSAGGVDVLTPVIKNLRFAILQADGKLLTGEKNMRIQIGQQLIFSVDAEGVRREQPLPVRLSYYIVETGKSEFIADATLTDNHQVLAGRDGYFAFAPEEPGRYRLQVVSDQSGQGEKESHAEISIQVVAPD